MPLILVPRPCYLYSISLTFRPLNCARWYPIAPCASATLPMVRNTARSQPSPLSRSLAISVDELHWPVARAVDPDPEPQSPARLPLPILTRGRRQHE